MPWSKLASVVEPYYPKISDARGRPPLPLERMVTVNFTARRSESRIVEAGYQVQRLAQDGSYMPPPAMIGEFASHRLQQPVGLLLDDRVAFAA